MKKKDLTNLSKSEPVEPYINEDGWYTQCRRCLKEIKPTNSICPNCNQKQDWTWFKHNKEKGE